MKSARRGFTLIEVAIFLAITGLLFVGIAAGVQGSLNAQRENDTAQSFLEFLRGVYAQVSNVQNPEAEGGRSEQAIYGKMVTFGEEYTLTDEKNQDGKEIFVYTVVGRIKDSGTGDALKLLDELNITVLDGNNYAGLVESYSPKWDASLETACTGTGSCSPKAFTGTLLIVRHPTSGNIYTYFNKNVINVNRIKKEGGGNIFKRGDINYLTDATEGFEQKAVDICVNTSGVLDSNARRFDIRIAAGATNASGVGLVTDGESACKK